MLPHHRRDLPKNLPSMQKGLQLGGPKFLWLTEAPVGIEPTNGGFADLCLTTWLRRRGGMIRRYGGRAVGMPFELRAAQDGRNRYPRTGVPPLRTRLFGRPLEP